MKLSIVIPVYNEKNTILEIIKKVENADTLGLEKEIILVDDCSKDGSRDILKGLKSHKVFFHEENKGKGGALKTGFRNATGDIVLIQDADLEYNPDNYPILLKPFLDGDYDVIFGSRFLRKKFQLTGKDKIINRHHFFGNKALSLLTSILYLRKITDMETGYKVFKKSVLDSITIKSDRFDFEPEFTSKIFKKKLKFKEVPIDFHPRTFEEGKKISWKDGIVALIVLIKYRFKF